MMLPIQQRYQMRLQQEIAASGRMPKIAVIGEYDFDTLAGELATLYGLELKAREEAPSQLDYFGIAVFKSYDNKHGVWFGGGEA